MNDAHGSFEAQPALRSWFIAHFLVDMLFAIPLMIAPKEFLGIVGMENVDPVLARLVAAALFAIGIQSWIGRNEGREAYTAMLNLKIIWASSAVVGMLWGLSEGAPTIVWGFVGIFGAFLVVWIHFRKLLQRS